MRVNKTKAKILAGQPAFGINPDIPSPFAVELAGALGFDWVFIDCEHGPMSE